MLVRQFNISCILISYCWVFSWQGQAAESQELVHTNSVLLRCTCAWYKSSWADTVQNEMWDPKWNHPAAEKIPDKQQPEVWSINSCDPAPAIWGKNSQLSNLGFNCLNSSQQGFRSMLTYLYRTSVFPFQWLLFSCGSSSKPAPGISWIEKKNPDTGVYGLFAASHPF